MIPIAALLRMLGLPFLLVPCLIFWLGVPASAEDFWRMVPTQTGASLRGLYPIDRTTAWVCGSQGTLMRTIDGGQSWVRSRIEGLDEKTELRSIHAWSAQEVMVATAGSPCRIYSTKDGGEHWRVVYENPRPEAFIDGMRFWDRDRGFAFGDPIDSKLMGLYSDDRGQRWRMSSANEYVLRVGEAGFAASNSSLMVYGAESVWIGLGGAAGPAQVLVSDDAGRSWTRESVEAIPGGKSSGIFSLARSSSGGVVAVGGDYTKLDIQDGNAAWWDPESKQWRKPRGRTPGGFRSSVVWLSKPIRWGSSPSGEVQWVCAGPNGCDGSVDAQDWFSLTSEPFHALEMGGDGSLWGCGSGGRVGVHEPR